ncbi:MAG TPA: hypothetical protein VM621_17855 [Luteibacter sp.]|uniref:hypothetical protein n=1 Tax=Luteibacter sp. TaxID=1886636 RepID=UPI002CD97919|nr:hypothetical protein [Luteibacter sp.]HVI56909.1 hypothetical protein [Luteibacter sp.]
MASIFTGLAFMHGHIVDRDLVFRLGREERVADRGAGVPQAVPTSRKAERKASVEVPARRACATC